ncbi:rhodanese-related sulfurtransferase [Aneurinibacillus soli]|uniref:Putative adenylyltransferase/sulfurtransferase MoeZ n=1 Tax=Aneurinibacillus soli TaxID=1500254 RepID=A0A0U5AZF0_9BACL|nr:rhodanese-like domain-containing protein [Aneurinibacillus soli]PYE62796.1 rhodanese-related sulfurtransferase [Aneurinibacillus soli]BAU29146.1 putative adenylyltransferase/sulfurtransferase MoeZ [Aneurinibacillus soli]
MDWLSLALLVLLLGFFVFRMLPPRGVKKITADELSEALKNPKGKQFIDVRETDEYRQGHIQHARNIPLMQVKTAVGGIQKDKDTYLICETGVRSAQAARILKKHGVQNLYNLSGGMKRWTGKVVKK